jgi:uncharacterized protein (DUF952 family)
MLIYHITTRSEWENALTLGSYSAPSLDEEGFIHASTAQQVAATADLLFGGITGLVLLEIDTDRLAADLRFEEAPGTGQQFPHIYGPLNLDAVRSATAFYPGDDGLFHFPPEDQ